MGDSFSVDDKLKDNPDDPRYVFWCIQHNDYKAFRRAISTEAFSANPDIIYKGEGKQVDWGFSPLIHCCYELRTKMASDLINKHGDTMDLNLKCTNEHEWTALHWAVENGWKGTKELVDVLLKNGANYNTVYDNKGRSAFDLSDSRQYWDLNMRFILGNLTEGRQSIVMDEQARHEEEDATVKYIANELLKTYQDQAAVAGFKQVLYEICAGCITKKKPIDSTLYILAYEISNNEEKNTFCDLILNAVDKLLDNKQSTKLDTAWLRKYLLKCCIWQKKYYAPIEDGVAPPQDDHTDDGSDNEELNRLRRENKRLRKIIDDNGYKYDVEDGVIDDILNEIKEDSEEDEANTKGETESTDDATKETKKAADNEKDKATSQGDDDAPKTKDENDTTATGETETADAETEKEDAKSKQNIAWDAYIAVFKRNPNDAKEFKYFSHRISRERNNPNLRLTFKEAQDTYRLKSGKNIDINLGMSKQQEAIKEVQRIRDERDAARPVMYEKLLAIVTQKNYEEQQDLKRNLSKYEESKENGIELIKSIKPYRAPKKTGPIRQDSFSLRAHADKGELQDLSNEEKGFDGEAYYSRNIYTQELLLLSHQLNEAYQTTIKHIFEEVNPAHERVKVMPGPVKKGSRIIEKSETKYRRETFPVPAKVLDTLRCSVVFKEPKDLHAGIEWFIKYVHKEQEASKEDQKEDAEETEGIGYFKGAKGNIESVVRSKNMFTDPEVNWDMSNPGYADLKYNVVFTFNGKKIVCEIQFLIKEMMATKKKIHGFYSIMRYQDIFAGLQQNIKKITPERRFASLVRAKKDPDIKQITDLMITFGFNGSNTLVDENWMRYALHFSAEYKTNSLTKLLLMSSEVNVNIGDKFNQTPLNQAVWAGDLPGIKLLLADPRIDVHQLNNDGQEPLGFQHGTTGHQRVDILKALIEAGCSPCVQETTRNDDIHQINKDKYVGQGAMNVLHRLASVAGKNSKKNDEFLENFEFICDVKDTYSYTNDDLKKAIMTKDASGRTVLDWCEPRWTKKKDDEPSQEIKQEKTKAFLQQYLAGDTDNAKDTGDKDGVVVDDKKKQSK